MSPSSTTPVLTEREQRPWRYSYRRDVQLGWHGELVLRPLLPVSLVNGDRGTPQLAGLVASGADLTLVSGLLAEQLGIGLEDYEGEGAHRFGIGEVRARYKTIDLRLHAPDAGLHSPDDLCLHSSDDLRLHSSDDLRLHSSDDLRLHSRDAAQDPNAAQGPDAAQDGYRQWRQWRSRIGFVEDWPSNGFVVLGNVGFFDQFEVAISAFAHSVAVAHPSGDYVSAAPGPDFAPKD